jgi:hypothetical protein
MHCSKFFALATVLLGCSSTALQGAPPGATHTATVDGEERAPTLAPLGLPAPPAHFAAHENFKRALFPTDKACAAAMHSFGVNCFQEVDFEADGHATVIVTDIVNAGTYTIAGSVVTVTLDSLDGDAGEKLSFTLAKDQRTMTDAQKNVWSSSLCGVTACSAAEFCETVASDAPEFDGSFTRHACRPLPGCDTTNVCECLAGERCTVGSASFAGACSEASANFFTLTCNIGG